MNLAHRIADLERQAEAQRAGDPTIPEWVHPLWDCEMEPTSTYRAWGAVLDAIAAGRCFVLYPEHPSARRLAVDFLMAGASQNACYSLRAWLEYINQLWDSEPPESKPETIEQYAEWLAAIRAEMSFLGHARRRRSRGPGWYSVDDDPLF